MGRQKSVSVGMELPIYDNHNSKINLSPLVKIHCIEMTYEAHELRDSVYLECSKEHNESICMAVVHKGAEQRSDANR